jgi:lipopolysaccharide biosynthesis regulator YciM
MMGESLAFVFLLFAIGALLAFWYYQEKTAKGEKKNDSFVAGLKAIVTGENIKAMKLLREAALFDTNNLDAYLLLGDLVRERGNPRKALQIHHSLSERGIISASQKSRVLKSVALDYAAIGEHENAVNALKRAISLAPDNWLNNFLLGELEKLGRWEAAFDILSGVKGKDGIKKNQLALYKVMSGNLAAEGAQYHAARVFFKEALRVDPECKPAYIRIGDAYWAESRIDDAVEWWTKFIEKFPKIAWIVFERLERAAYHQGDFGRMITFYADFIIKYPDNAQARISLSGLYERMGRVEDAIAVLKNLPSEPTLETDIAYLDLIRKRDNIGGDTSGLIEKLRQKISQNREYACKSCSHISGEAVWYCPKCGAWNSFGI